MRKLEDVLKDWEAVIGLEVHTELTTLDTKMFCNCRLSHDDPPNTNVCPVCLGMPGALPVPNRKAIQSIVMAGLATNCQIMKHSMFYRKHYFYPDMAKNFQTTQGPVAFCMHGHLDLEVEGAGAAERPSWEDVAADGQTPIERADDGSYTVPIRILRIHMEEDAAKMVHSGGEEGRITGASESFVDYNRCGTPLIELVTEPDLRTPEEARLFMEKLQQTFKTLGISDCSLENGSMRCDGNISLRRRGETRLGTKAEMKNINSFKSLHDALEYEICRQAEVLEEGGTIYQETRHWEPSRRRTVVMRVKETADDYRLFPDPDLAPFDLTDDFVEEARARIPELPDAKAARYVAELGLKRADARQIAGDPQTAALFEDGQARLDRRERDRQPRARPRGRHGGAGGVALRAACDRRHHLRPGARGARCRGRHGRGPRGRGGRARHAPGHGHLRARARGGRGARALHRPGAAVPRRQQEGRGLPGGPVHEGEPRPGQPEALQPAASPEAGGIALSRAAATRAAAD